MEEYCRKVSQAFYPLEVKLSRGDATQGPVSTQFSSERRGLFRLTRGVVRHPMPIRGARGWRNIDSATPDEFILVRAQKTSIGYRQFGRLAELAAGGAVLLDARSPYEFERRASGAITCHHLPGYLLRASHPHPEDLCALAIAPSGTGAVILDLLASVWRNMDQMSESARQELMGQVGALFPLACQDPGRKGGRARPERNSQGPLEDHRPGQEPHLMRAIRLIESRLDDPALDVETVAKGIGLSQSHLHAIARRHGMSIHRMIQQSRLDHCARELRQPDARDGAAATRITSIAFRWGFSDAAHFSRAFRAQFGRSPREYREAAHAKTAPKGAKPPRQGHTATVNTTVNTTVTTTAPA